MMLNPGERKRVYVPPYDLDDERVVGDAIGGIRGTAVSGFGASEDEWNHWSLILGLGKDLLPVVSNPNAIISKQSSLCTLGKTPSRYNGNRHVVGIPKWTEYRATQADILKWSRNSDFGICLQTRVVRALDCDISDPILAKNVHDEIDRILGLKLPMRRRSNDAKFLLAFTMPGQYPKRIIRCDGGVIEFLGSGQHAVVAGTHTSRVRYEWKGGLPDEIPTLAPELFEKLWARLIECFGSGAQPTEARPTVAPRAARLTDAIRNDPVAQALLAKEARVERDGKLLLRCPFADGHTPGGNDNIAYFPAATGGYHCGHFRCLHASCGHRTDGDYFKALGIEPSHAEDFDVLSDGDIPTVRQRFASIPLAELLAAPSLGWHVKGVLPRADIGLIYGPSGSGKSFVVLDMLASIARGVPWRGRRVKQSRVTYICAEGSAGLGKRIAAYLKHHEIPDSELPLRAITDVPNFLKEDHVALARQINAEGGADIIVVDTLAQTTPGGDENGSEDMGKALTHCRQLGAETGATVLLVHHAGKDLSRGARGWSGLKAAADVELSVELKEGDATRVLALTKLKDGRDQIQFPFKLKVIPLDMDEDGDVVESCVIDHLNEMPIAAPRGESERRVWDAVCRLRNKEGRNPDRRAVITEAVAHAPKPFGRDSRKSNHSRALRKLLDDGRLDENSEGVSVRGGAK